MDALMLAAGLGTRLHPFTSVLPKCLMPIQGRPLLGLWLEMLQRGGVERVFVNLHYLSTLVREYIAGSPYAARVTFLDEPELLGTAGTLGHFRQSYGSDTLLMAHADNLTLFDVAAFKAAFDGRPDGCSMTMMTFETDDPKSCGIVTTDDRGRIIEFTEKPEKDIGRLANGAVYIMDLPEIFRHMDQGDAISDFSTQILPHFIGRMNSFHNNLYHRDIGNIRALADAQRDIRQLAAADDLLTAIASYWQPEGDREMLREGFLEQIKAEKLDQETARSLLKS